MKTELRTNFGNSMIEEYREDYFELFAMTSYQLPGHLIVRYHIM